MPAPPALYTFHTTRSRILFIAGLGIIGLAALAILIHHSWSEQEKRWEQMNFVLAIQDEVSTLTTLSNHAHRFEITYRLSRQNSEFEAFESNLWILVTKLKGDVATAITPEMTGLLQTSLNAVQAYQAAMKNLAAQNDQLAELSRAIQSSHDGLFPFLPDPKTLEGRKRRLAEMLLSLDEMTQTIARDRGPLIREQLSSKMRELIRLQAAISIGADKAERSIDPSITKQFIQDAEKILALKVAIEAAERQIDIAYHDVSSALDYLRSFTQQQTETLLSDIDVSQAQSRTVTFIAVAMIIGVIATLSLTLAHHMSRRFHAVIKALDRLAMGERQVPIPYQNDGSEFGRISSFLSAYQMRTEELQAAKSEADRASRAKTSFLAHMSHELRTPLNAIIGFSQMIEHQVFGAHDTSKYSEYGRDIRRSGEHLLQLVGDILDISKVEAGHIDFDAQKVDLITVSTEAIRLVSPLANQKKITLKTTFAVSEALMSGDPLYLRQVAVNLLSNAIKFSNPGSEVSLTLTRHLDGFWIWRFRDQGVGIAAIDIDRVLQPFEQVAKNRSITNKGTGLGLSIAQSLIKLHNGQLNIISEFGRGTEVRVTLPSEFNENTATHVELNPEKSASAPSKTSTNKRQEDWIAKGSFTNDLTSA